MEEIRLFLYQVLSEELVETVYEDYESSACHEEEYRICEWVIARNSSQARYLAAKSDPNYWKWESSIVDMPKFSVHKIGNKVYNGPSRIVTNEPDFLEIQDKG
jgi:hypothetical protein